MARRWQQGDDALKGRDVVADFGGGAMTSNAGAFLLGATGRAIGLVDRFAACISDGREAGRVEHDVAALVASGFWGSRRATRT